jgi:hypothetical protein
VATRKAATYFADLVPAYIFISDFSTIRNSYLGDAMGYASVAFPPKWDSRVPGLYLSLPDNMLGDLLMDK